MAKSFPSETIRALRGYARSTGATPTVSNPYEFIMICDGIPAAQAAAEKFSNAAMAVIGYGSVSTQVRFTPI